MSAQLRVKCAAIRVAVTNLFQLRHGAIALMVALGLASCRDAPMSPAAAPDPADPRAPAPRVGYRSTIDPYTSQRPVSPGPWREQNERVTPAPKSGEQKSGEQKSGEQKSGQ
jgi:hypothetical protein